MNFVLKIHMTIMLQVNGVLVGQCNHNKCSLFEELIANDCLNHNIRALRKLGDIIATIVCH